MWAWLMWVKCIVYSSLQRSCYYYNHCHFVVVFVIFIAGGFVDMFTDVCEESISVEVLRLASGRETSGFVVPLITLSTASSSTSMLPDLQAFWFECCSFSSDLSICKNAFNSFFIWGWAFVTEDENGHRIYSMCKMHDIVFLKRM